MNEPSQAPPRIVGIGAAAGGIIAFQSLFTALPPNDLAFLVVQHLVPEVRSSLARLIGAWSGLPTCDAEDGMRPEPARVYLARPGEHLTLEGGVLRCRPAERQTSRSGSESVDVLFASLATELGERSVGVVLSGTGSDGAAGALRIRHVGGLVFVQDPQTAMHDGMPTAVMAASAACRVLPPSELALELAACAEAGYRPLADATVGDTAGALDDILGVVRVHAGMDLTAYRVTPLLWRIQRRMGVRRIARLRDYGELLRDDPAELEALVRCIPIHVTEFFRDPEAWQVVEDEVLPALLRNHAGDSPIRAWTAACASGEEAYSVAMLLAEQASSATKPVDFTVFATDASASIVAQAARGVFAADALHQVSPKRRARFFYDADGAIRVARPLRKKLIFAPQDLLVDPPFHDLDLATCRNMLIYLDAKAAARVVRLLHASLRMGGYLVLGRSEELPRDQPGFEVVSARWRIYRKTAEVSALTVDAPRHVPRAAATHVEEQGAAIAQCDPTFVAYNVDRAYLTARSGGETDPAITREPTTMSAWSQALQLSHDELDASREEMQALNEELKACNDQLNRLNEELTNKLSELETQRAVLFSGAVMTLALDADLRVLWFTPAVAEIIPLMPGDTGRRFTDFATQVDDPGCVGEARAVMTDGSPREGEVRSVDGRWYLRRIRPYGAAGTGAAVTFTDITERRAAEASLRASEARLAVAAQAEGLAKLNDASSRLWPLRNLEHGLDEMLLATIDMLGADRGNVQLHDAERGVLRIAAQRGFAQEFLDFFREVRAEGSSACARALRSGQRVLIEDVENDAAYLGSLAAARAAGYRAVQSTPLVSRSGTPLGVISTHWREPHRCSEHEIRLLDLYARQATDFIERSKGDEARGRLPRPVKKTQKAFRQ